MDKLSQSGLSTQNKEIVSFSHAGLQSNYGSGNQSGERGRFAKNDVSVRIYVMENCFACDYAMEVAETIQDKFPEVDVRIVDMANPSEAIPDNVFATPTYLLNGRVWSLGNPSPEQVTDTLTEYATA